MLKDSTFIASPMLEILSQIEMKFNWLPVTPFLVYRPVSQDQSMDKSIQLI